MTKAMVNSALPPKSEAGTELIVRRRQLVDTGFHTGELAVQRQAGVEARAARLARMLEPVELEDGIAGFLADRTFAAMTARTVPVNCGSRRWSAHPGS